MLIYPTNILFTDRIVDITIVSLSCDHCLGTFTDPSNVRVIGFPPTKMVGLYCEEENKLPTYLKSRVIAIDQSDTIPTMNAV